MPRLAHKYRIELAGVKPLIWRKILVPADYSFWDLHVAIQDAMGWLDYHLHEFTVKDPGTGATARIGIPETEDDDVMAGWEIPVAGFFQSPETACEYSYDFGDDWQHAVIFEGAVELDPGQPDLACIAGEGACPPEDCGGAHGYATLLEAISDPEHELHAELTEWLGGAFDARRFSASEVVFDDPDERWQLAFGGAT